MDCRTSQLRSLAMTDFFKFSAQISLKILNFPIKFKNSKFSPNFYPTNLKISKFFAHKFKIPKKNSKSHKNPPKEIPNFPQKEIPNFPKNLKNPQISQKFVKHSKKFSHSLN